MLQCEEYIQQRASLQVTLPAGEMSTTYVDAVHIGPVNTSGTGVSFT